MDRIAVGAAGAHRLTPQEIAGVPIHDAENRRIYHTGILVGSKGIQGIDPGRSARVHLTTRRPTATLAVSVPSRNSKK